MEIHTRQLRYFVAVAEELSFTRAAQRLHVAQQGLSAQIRQLEKALDLVLFTRTTRSVELTAAGAALLEGVRSALTTLEMAVEGARVAQRRESDRLVLGYLEGAALTLTEPILAAFREQHPGVTVDMRQFTYEEPAAGLESGSVDVAFVRLPFRAQGIRFEPLFAEPLVALVPAAHRLAELPEVRVRDLLDEPLLGAATTDPEWNAFWELHDHRDGRPAPVVSRSSSLLEELHKVAVGVGVVLTVASARWMPFPRVRLLPVADAPRNEVTVGWRADRETSLVRSFVKIARDVRDANPDLVACLESPDFEDCTLPLHM
ncbi:LysR substrate-binding domain-containing protein [Nocardia sp. CA-151230]|uniref:LysR substrate-binding domain-containing protein n=1 Tax=Nocardia sp. CA-151230 TaxID=3239982 RepID=UPI003D8CED33